MTIFADVLTKFIETLQTEPVVCPEIYRARDRQIGEEIPQAINLQCAGSEAKSFTISGNQFHWHTKIIVDCYARSTVLSGDLAVDDLFESVIERLSVNQRLNTDFIFDIGAPVIEMDVDAQGQKTGWVRLTYTVFHASEAS